MSQGELPDFDLDNSYTIPPTGEPHNLDDTVDYSDDEDEDYYFELKITEISTVDISDGMMIYMNARGEDYEFLLEGNYTTSDMKPTLNINLPNVLFIDHNETIFHLSSNTQIKVDPNDILFDMNVLEYDSNDGIISSETYSTLSFTSNDDEISSVIYLMIHNDEYISSHMKLSDIPSNNMTDVTSGIMIYFNTSVYKDHEFLLEGNYYEHDNDISHSVNITKLLFQMILY